MQCSRSSYGRRLTSRYDGSGVPARFGLRGVESRSLVDCIDSGELVGIEVNEDVSIAVEIAFKRSCALYQYHNVILL